VSTLAKEFTHEKNTWQQDKVQSNTWQIKALDKERGRMAALAASENP
jgi:hypothetical protein